ncbi:MAG: DUF4412 domain-containing protein [Ginsengibacter sp.]
MKTSKIIISIFCLFVAYHAQAQKALTEGSLVYNISVETGSAEPKMADMLDGATTTVFIKGNQSRTEMVSGLGTEATIHNATNGTGVILKEYSGQKLMITLTDDDWAKNNKKYDGIIFESTGETSVINGYNCRKAIAKLKDGTSFVVYYTNDVAVSNKNYDYQFKTLPGLAIQYEMQSGKMKFKFTLSKINFQSVPEAKFEIPKTGYRVLTYEETKK